MQDLGSFVRTGKGLSRNPLGIIALFIVLIYGFASLVVGVRNDWCPDERQPIVWFLVIFPVVVLGVFSLLVIRHHGKLYAPEDFSDDVNFLRLAQERSEGRPGLSDRVGEIRKIIHETLTSQGTLDKIPQDRNELLEKLDQVANEMTAAIAKSSFITIDLQEFTKHRIESVVLPLDAFASFNDLTDDIFFRISEYVRPFEYGYSWVLRDKSNDEIIMNARMITGTERGVPLDDRRSLEEVGIVPGTTLEVVAP